MKFVPRDFKGFDILDLGAGDGRMYHFFVNKNFHSFTACDIAEKLLAKHPQTPKVTKIICDLEQEFPEALKSFDLVLSFFVLEHIENLSGLFEEVEKHMKPGATRIIGHFKQRKAHKYHINHENFKIERFTHHIKDIQKWAEYVFLDYSDEEIRENGVSIGHIIILKKQT
ncbi:MAG: class I SAM-dependent methyltransferase [bacterium]|nr:class I SAM-dependent methyltransferase [bacterium]